MTKPNANDFRHLRVDMKNVLRIVCCSCTETADRTLAASGKRSCDQAFAEKMFRNIKWHVGSDRNKDKCPLCIKAEKMQVRMITEKVRPALKANTEQNMTGKSTESNVVPLSAYSNGIGCLTELASDYQKDRKVDSSGQLSSDYQKGSDTDALAKLIADHTYSKANGLRVYRAGMTDSRMSEMTGMRIDIVRATRTALFGLSRAKRAVRPTGASAGQQQTQQQARQITELQQQLEAVLASQQALQAQLEASNVRQAQTEKLLQTLASAVKASNERLQELSDEFDLFSEPVSVSPRSLMQLFNGSAHLKARSTQTMHHKRS